MCLSAVAAITNSSGKPSKSVSPRRMGSGTAGEKVVSSTRRELDGELTSEEKGI